METDDQPIGEFSRNPHDQGQGLRAWVQRALDKMRAEGEDPWTPRLDDLERRLLNLCETVEEIGQTADKGGNAAGQVQSLDARLEDVEGTLRQLNEGVGGSLAEVVDAFRLFLQGVAEGEAPTLPRVVQVAEAPRASSVDRETFNVLRDRITTLETTLQVERKAAEEAKKAHSRALSALAERVSAMEARELARSPVEAVPANDDRVAWAVAGVKSLADYAQISRAGLDRLVQSVLTEEE